MPPAGVSVHQPSKSDCIQANCACGGTSWHSRTADGCFHAEHEAHGLAGDRDSPAAFLALAAEDAQADTESTRPARARGSTSSCRAAAQDCPGAKPGRLVALSSVAALYEGSPGRPSHPSGGGAAAMSIVVSKPPAHQCAAFSAYEGEAERREWAQHVPPALRPRTAQLLQEIQAMGRPPRRWLQGSGARSRPPEQAAHGGARVLDRRADRTPR
mmetsp:Transcript_105907/g.330255  ORF Transcript_105907/g.330255 Transcript_105907/m.330255 type:complete len:214 (-) Transcript_105907:57-698(-)